MDDFSSIEDCFYNAVNTHWQLPLVWAGMLIMTFIDKKEG
jgi:hypothetical protein